MFALKSGPRRSFAMQDGGGFVLPRWLRRPARAVLRISVGDIEPPRFAATMASLALFAATGAYGAVAGGHSDAIVQALTARSGFAISDIQVTGNRYTSEIDVLQTIGLDGWTSLIGFDAAQTRDRVAELPWVESASVRKVYPSTLEVSLVERKPFAIWQNGSRLTIIERSGGVIAPFGGGKLASLPLIVGMGATEAAPAFIDTVKRHGGLAGRVKAYIRVGDRRWDLRLDNGVTVKLPEGGEDAAIADLIELDRKFGLLSRDIVAVDMRLADRLAVRLSPEAAERRAAEFEDGKGART